MPRVTVALLKSLRKISCTTLVELQIIKAEDTQDMDACLRRHMHQPEAKWAKSNVVADGQEQREVQLRLSACGVV